MLIWEYWSIHPHLHTTDVQPFPEWGHGAVKVGERLSSNPSWFCKHHEADVGGKTAMFLLQQFIRSLLGGQSWTQSMLPSWRQSFYCHQVTATEIMPLSLSVTDTEIHAAVTFSHGHRSPCHCHWKLWTQKSMPVSLKIMVTEIHVTVTFSHWHRNSCLCHWKLWTQKSMPLSLSVTDAEIHATVTNNGMDSVTVNHGLTVILSLKVPDREIQATVMMCPGHGKSMPLSLKESPCHYHWNSPCHCHVELSGGMGSWKDLTKELSESTVADFSPTTSASFSHLILFSCSKDSDRHW